MNKAIIAFVLVALFCASCNKESTVGSELLGNETIDVTFVDTIKVTAVSRYDEPSVTYRNSSQFNDQTYLLGNLDDPVFGKTSASLYLTPSRFTAFPLMTTLDSVVMSLPIDTSGIYGDTLQTHTIEVFQLVEPLELEGTGDTLRSDFCDIESKIVPMGSVTRMVNPRQNVSFFNPDTDTIVEVGPQVRIPLESPIWEEIKLDTNLQKSDTALLSIVNGFHVTSSGAENSMFGFDLRNTSSQSYLQWYYVDTARAKQTYIMNVGRLRHNCIEHDRSGSEIESAIGLENQENNYLQSMGGVYTEYDLSKVLDLDPNELINSAVLEIFADNGTDEFYPGDAVYAYYIDENGEEAFIKDIDISSNGNDSRLVFDGTIRSTVVNGQTIQKYNLFITSHVIDIIRGRVQNTKIRVKIVPALDSNQDPGQRPTRTVLYSPSHPEFPVNLKLILSNP